MCGLTVCCRAVLASEERSCHTSSSGSRCHGGFTRFAKHLAPLLKKGNKEIIGRRAAEQHNVLAGPFGGGLGELRVIVWSREDMAKSVPLHSHRMSPA